MYINNGEKFSLANLKWLFNKKWIFCHHLLALMPSFSKDKRPIFWLFLSHTMKINGLKQQWTLYGVVWTETFFKTTFSCRRISNRFGTWT